MQGVFLMVLDSIQRIVRISEKLKIVVWLWKEIIWMKILTFMVC
ncbi:hypothetical protein LINPERPRIM_LOCUS20459 [Linum perenne]